MKNNTKRALSTSTIASLLITSSAVSVSVKAAAVTPPENPRLWGADRYETAVKVSQAGWADGSDYAIIASGEGYADALSAAPLAKVNNAPILLTQSKALSQTTLDELKRLKVKHVFIIGGQGVVSQAIEDTIKTQVTSDIQRLWGQNRYETSVKVAEKLGKPAKIVLASGEGYADALSAAPVAAIEGIPVILTQSSTLSTAAANYIKANSSITKTYVIGGTASVSDAALSAVPSAQRFGGADRFETNAAVINGFATDFNFKNAYVALGNGPVGNEFADALSASAVAAKNAAPVILTNKTLSSSTQTLAETTLFPSSTITVLGGVANVPDEVVAGLKVSATFLSEAGKTYSDAVDGNVEITADNVALKGNVKGDLYLSGNNASISNITVDGTVYVNPGETGVSNLDTVTAKNIVVLSGAKDSIHLKNVKADKLKVSSRNNVRITSEGTTAIASTVVASQAILEATSGSFGIVNVPQTAGDKTVEFKGNFDKAVVVEGNVDIKTAAGTNIAALVVSEKVKASEIKIQGNGTIKNIQVKSETAVLNIDKNISVTGKIEAVKKDSVKSENSSITGKVEQKDSGSMSDVTNGGSTTTPPTGGGGGSTGGSGTTYTDITSLVSTVYGNKIASRVQNHPTLQKNVDVNATGNPIVVTLKNTNLYSLDTIFNNVQNDDISLIEARITKAQGVMDLYSSLFSVSGVPFEQYLALAEDKYISSGGNVRYINSDGSFNVDEIASRIKNNTLTYDQFKAHLRSRVEAMCNETKTAPTLSISAASISQTVTKVVKDGSVVYDTTASRETNIQNLVNLGDGTKGTYTIYCGSNYFTVKVQ